MPDWDKWKTEDNYILRRIYADEAEKQQICLKPWERGFISENEQQIMVRGVFVGSIPKTWTARLSLGDHSPMVFVTTDQGVTFSFVPNWDREVST